MCKNNFNVCYQLKMTNIVKFWNLGRALYDKSNIIQQYLSKLHSFEDVPITKESLANIERKMPLRTRNTLLIIEHEPVYTTGLRDCLSLPEQSKLESLGAQYRKVNRGGLATFHGPGQITAYPVLNLRHFKPSVKWFVCRLEQTAIDTCNKFGIKAERSPHTGVWVKDKKVCAIGVHISRGVTTHGLAINCSTDLKWFEHIVPCGIEGKGVTSITEELSKTMTIETVLPTFKNSFEDIFNCHLVEMTEAEKMSILEAVKS